MPKVIQVYILTKFVVNNSKRFVRKRKENAGPIRGQETIKIQWSLTKSESHKVSLIMSVPTKFKVNCPNGLQINRNIKTVTDGRTKVTNGQSDRKYIAMHPLNYAGGE